MIMASLRRTCEQRAMMMGKGYFTHIYLGGEGCPVLDEKMDPIGSKCLQKLEVKNSKNSKKGSQLDPKSRRKLIQNPSQWSNER